MTGRIGTGSWSLVAMAWIGVCGTSCAEKRWNDERAMELHAGSFSFVVPTGWREVRELHAPVEAVPPGMSLLVPEDVPGDAEVAVSQLDVARGEDCARVGQRFEGPNTHVVHVESVTFDGDRGCAMNMFFKYFIASLQIRIHGDHAVFVRCIGQRPDVFSACSAVLHSLKPTGAAT